MEPLKEELSNGNTIINHHRGLGVCVCVWVWGGGGGGHVTNPDDPLA